MKKKTVWFCGIAGFLAILCGPLMIIVAFHLPKSSIITTLQEKDFLSYYTSLLGIGITICTFILAYRHTLAQIVHNQEYNRNLKHYSDLKKTVDEQMDKIHPQQLKTFRLISKDDASQYVYSLFYNLEQYKLTATLAAEKINDAISQNGDELLRVQFGKDFLKQLQAYEEANVKLTDKHLEFYQKVIEDIKAKKEMDFHGMINRLNEDIDAQCAEHQKMQRLLTSGFSAILSEVAKSRPDPSIK